MDWILKGVLTAGSVALVLLIAQRWGRGAAGFIAGLPTVTAPALAWVALDHGIGFAMEAARATVTMSAVLAVFALVYAHLAGRVRPLAALVGAMAAAGALTGPALAASVGLVAAVALSVGCSVFALMAWPGVAREDRPPCPRWWSTALASAASGVISIGVAVVVPALGAVWAGLLSSVPVVSASVAVAEHAVGGQPAVLQFMRGCVAGLLGRIAFGAFFALTAGDLGLAWGLGLACVAAGVVNLAAARRLHLRDQARRVAAEATRRARAARYAHERCVENMAP